MKMAVQKSHRSLRKKKIRLANNIYLKKLKLVGLMQQIRKKTTINKDVVILSSSIKRLNNSVFF